MTSTILFPGFDFIGGSRVAVISARLAKMRLEADLRIRAKGRGHPALFGATVDFWTSPAGSTLA